MTDDKILIFFDGPCNFCNSFVNFIIKKDRYDKFRFASLQSSFAHKVLKDINYNTIIVKHNSVLLNRSLAVIYIFSHLSFPYNLSVILKILPIKFLDFIYNFIAKRRNKIFKNNKCLLPTNSLKQKIIQ